MDKRKIKIWKIVLLVIVVIMLLFIIMTARKIIILSSLDNKISEYYNSKDSYVKRVANSSSLKSQIIEVYVKDDTIKQVIENEREDGTWAKLIQITYPNQRKFYTDNGTDKVMNIYNENNTDSFIGNGVVNVAEYYAISEKIIDSVTSRIKTTEIGGKKCYEISSLHNSNFLYEEGTEEFRVYVEKDTGLLIKIVTIVNRDGNRNEYITTYDYEFDNITEEDMAEPDISEYIVQEDN